MKTIRRMILLLLMGTMVFLTAREMQNEKLTPLSMDEVREELSLLRSVSELKESTPRQILRELGKNDAEFFSAQPEDLTGVYWYADYLMDATEILVLKSDDEHWLLSCGEALRKRADEQAELFASYEPVQSSYLSGAIIEVRQGVLYYFVGADAQAGRDLMEKLLKKARG